MNSPVLLLLLSVPSVHEAVRDRQCNTLKTLFNGFDVIDSKGRESVENRAEIHRIVQCRRRGEMIVDTCTG